jgi:hypothetical protein
MTYFMILPVALSLRSFARLSRRIVLRQVSTERYEDVIFRLLHIWVLLYRNVSKEADRRTADVSIGGSIDRSSDSTEHNLPYVSGICVDGTEYGYQRRIVIAKLMDTSKASPLATCSKPRSSLLRRRFFVTSFGFGAHGRKGETEMI